MANPPPKIRWAVFVVIALLALGVRLPQLGERPMHTDESINAYIIGDLLAGQKYHYDPQDRHGPALYLLAKPVAQLCGARNFSELTESQLRLSTVLTGTVTVLLLGAGVEMFGFIPCLIAALLFAFAPLPVYYSRYFIHETLFVAATLGLILSGWRAWQRNSWLAAALAGFCAALMLACKETAVIHFFALGLAAIIGWRFQTTRKIPSAKIWLAALVAFIVTAVLLFTWGGQNWTALADLFRAIPNFAARAGGQGHEKPFWYYAHLFGGDWSGAAILVVVALGFFRIIHSPTSTARFILSIYALLICGIYSVIPYKTPWLALNFWLPLALLAGMAVEWLWLTFPKFSRRLMIFTSIMVIGILMAHDTRQWVFQMPADEKNPYAYAHTSEDLLRLPGRLEELARQNNLPNPHIAVVAADAWPLPWYLRKFSQVGFWQPGQDTGDANFFITTTDVSDKLAEQLKDFRPEFFGGPSGSPADSLGAAITGKTAMSETVIHTFNHSAMATQFQVRIANEDKIYAAQAAQAAFAVTDKLESCLSRFRANSEIAQIAQLQSGEKLRLSEPVFTCLEISKKMELATLGAFSVTAAVLKTQAIRPQWTLLKDEFSIRCDAGKLEFDLGAIGKGFALDRMAEELREWDCPVFLLVAGGSSIVAGDSPPETLGWSCGLGDNNSPERYWLKNCSLSGSGLAVKGSHIFDPRTGRTAQRQSRAWALADTGAESDALSTAAMVLPETEIADVVASNPNWLIFLSGDREQISFGTRPLPLRCEDTKIARMAEELTRFERKTQTVLIE